MAGWTGQNPADGPLEQSVPGQQTQVVSAEQWRQMEAAAQEVLVKADPASGESMAYLIDPAGKPAKIPEAASQEALSKGYRPMDDREAMEFDSPQVVPGAMETALLHGVNAALLGAPRGLSGLGMDSGGTKGTSIADILKLSEEAQPGAATVGSLAGSVVSGFAGPLAAVGRGGALLGKAAGAGISSQVGKRALEWGARGIAEGAAMGGKAAVDKATTDPNTSINDVLASIATGAAWGGVGGAGLSLLGSGASSVASKLSARTAAKRYEALRSQLAKATAKPAEHLAKIQDDLAEHWTQVPAGPRSPGGWSAPEKLQIVNQLETKLQELQTMMPSVFRQRMANAQSWEAQASALIERSGATQKAAAAKTLRVQQRAAGEAAGRDIEATVRKYQEGGLFNPSGKRYWSAAEAKGIAGEAAATSASKAANKEAAAMAPTIEFLQQQASRTAKQVRVQHEKLIGNVQSEIKRLTKELDSIKTTSGVKVPQLESAARQAEIDLAMVRQQTMDGFDIATPGAGAGLLGQWAAKTAVYRAMGGGTVGWTAGAILGKTVGELSGTMERIVGRAARIMGKKVTLRGSRDALGNVGAVGLSRAGPYAPRASVQAPSLSEMGKMAGKFSVLEAVSAASMEQIEEQARLSAKQAQLTFGLPDAAVEPAVQMNIRGMQFLQQKAKAIR